MQEHVGKKRRKEVRQAIEMHDELRKTVLMVIAAIAIGIAFTVTSALLTINGILAEDDVIAQYAPMVVILLLLVPVAGRAYQWTGLREEYKEHCKKFNITKEEMNALKNGQL